MKTFIAVTTYKNSKYAQNVIQKIYRIKRNIPIYLGTHTFNTGSMTGIDNECLGWLIRNKYLPKHYDLNKGKGTIYIDHKRHNKDYVIKVL